MSLRPQVGRAKPVETLPADGTGSPPLRAPRWPLVPVLPTPVVDGQRWCVGASYDVAVEYLGVGGVWVAQPSKQYGVWVWNGIEWVVQDSFLVEDDGDSILTNQDESIVVDDQNARIELDANGFVFVDARGNILRMV